MQDRSDTASSDTYSAFRYSTSEIPVHTSADRTVVARAKRPESVVQLDEHLEQLGSKVHLHGLHLTLGQNAQALLVKQEFESIKQQMEQYYNGLQAANAENKALQIQLNERMAEAEKMTKRILELQEEAREEFAKIQSGIEAILTQTYELHEFSIPRLFVVLPKEDITSTREKIETIFADRFRLFFLCECGEHTQTTDSGEITRPHHIHIARHGGYDLDRPNEFFRKYGTYVLTILQMLKYGTIGAGPFVPALNALGVVNEREYVAEGMKSIKKDLIPSVDTAIKYLQNLQALENVTSKDLRDTYSTAASVDPVSLSKLKGLEGTDLRNLATFLRGADKSKTLGNLYRTVTAQGHVKWVCLDHYREGYSTMEDKQFQRIVMEYEGTYTLQLGHVTVRLGSTLQAQQFYKALMSARHVQELELALDWRTGYDDLRELKEVLHQSNIHRLVLDLCSNPGLRRDVLTLSHRSEPIVQIMASRKIQTMALKNVTSFLSQAGDLFKTARVGVQHFDLGEQVVTFDDFAKLESLICASPALVRLGVMVRDIEGALERLKPVVAKHKILSILDLLQDNTLAKAQFEPGSDKIHSISLEVPESIPEKKLVALAALPKLTSVVLMDKTQLIRSSQFIHCFIKPWRTLKTITIAQLPEGGVEALRGLRRTVEVDASHLGHSKPGIGFMEVDSMHRRTPLWNIPLLVASVGESETQEATGMALGVGESRTRSIFVAQRENRALASVRFELNDGESNSVALHVSDFGALQISQLIPATKLTVVGGGGFGLLKVLIKSPTMQLDNLTILEFECKIDNHLDVLQRVHSGTTHHPALVRLILWNTGDKSKAEFTLPLQELRLLQKITLEQLNTLDVLLRAALALTRVTLLIPTLSGAFDIVHSAVQHHKQLSYVKLIASKSHASIQYIVGSGHIRSISLHTHELEFSHLLRLPMVTRLELGAVTELLRIKNIASLVFRNCEHLESFKIAHHRGQYLAIVSGFCEAAKVAGRSCRLDLAEIEVDVRHRKMRRLILPLKVLDLTWCLVRQDDHPNLMQIIVASPLLSELTLKVALPAAVFKSIRSCARKHESLSHLRLFDNDGAEAIARFEPGTGEVVSIVLVLTDNQGRVLQQDEPVLAVAHMSDAMLDLVGAIQEVAVINPGLESLTLRNKGGDASLTVEVPLKKINMEKRVISLKLVKSIKRLLMASPQLTELCLTVSSVTDLLETSFAFGPVVQKYKRLADVRLKLQDGTEASVRYSGEDGSVKSVALRMSDKFVAELSKMPMVKKITILPMDASIWRNTNHVKQELFKIVTLYQDLETVELDCRVNNPFAVLSLLQGLVTKQPQIHASPRLRRYRHRIVDSNSILTTHDLPLQKINLGVYQVNQNDLVDLEELVRASPLLTDVTLAVSPSTIERVLDKLEQVPEEFNRLQLIVLKSSDGYVMSRRLQPPLQGNGSSDGKLQEIYSVELQSVGGKYASYNFCQHVTQLIVQSAPAGRSYDHSSSNNRLCDILLEAKQRYPQLNHLVLTCTVKEFFEFLPIVSDFDALRRYDLKNPFLSTSIVSVLLESGPTATVYLDNSFSRDLLGVVSRMYRDYKLKVEISHCMNQRPEINISMDCPADTQDMVVRRVVFESRFPLTLVAFLDELSRVTNERDRPSLTFQWWIDHNAGGQSTVGKANERGKYSDEVLSNKVNMTKFANILTRRATELELDYEVLVALTPFVRSEFEKGVVRGLKPFYRLCQFHVYCDDYDSQEVDVAMFRSMVPDHAGISLYASDSPTRRPSRRSR